MTTLGSKRQSPNLGAMFLAVLIVAAVTAFIPLVMINLETAFARVGQFGLSLSVLGGWVFYSVLSFLVWTAALSLGLPVWGLLSRFDLNLWFVAPAVGFLIPFVVTLGVATGGFDGQTSASFGSGDNIGALWVNGHITDHGLRQAFRLPIFFGALGAGQALAIFALACWISRKRP